MLDKFHFGNVCECSHMIVLYVVSKWHTFHSFRVRLSGIVEICFSLCTKKNIQLIHIIRQNEVNLDRINKCSMTNRKKKQANKHRKAEAFTLRQSHHYWATWIGWYCDINISSAWNVRMLLYIFKLQRNDEIKHIHWIKHRYYAFSNVQIS